MVEHCLGSSSNGNCFVLELGTHTLLMVECGFPYKTIIRKSNQNGLDLSKLDGCLITHHHSDHSKSANELESRLTKVYATKETLLEIGIGGHTLTNLKATRINDETAVMPFEVEHDAIGSCGFIIKSNKETIIFINDNKRFVTNLSNFAPDYIFIECNFDEEKVYQELEELEKMESTSEVTARIRQLQRNVESHSSILGTIASLNKINKSNCKGIYLMHLSKDHQNPEKARERIKKEFGIATHLCLREGGISYGK